MPLTEPVEPAPWWQRRAAAGLAVGVDFIAVATLVFVMASTTPNPVVLAVLGITVLGAAAAILETLNAGWRAAGSGGQRYDGCRAARHGR